MRMVIVTKKQDLIKEVDLGTLLDRLRKLEAKVSIFSKVSKDLYDSFNSKIDEIRKMYKREAKEYKEAYRTNKLTLSCDPEVNLNIRHAIYTLEEEVDEMIKILKIRTYNVKNDIVTENNVKNNKFILQYVKKYYFIFAAALGIFIGGCLGYIFWV